MSQPTESATLDNLLQDYMIKLCQEKITQCKHVEIDGILCIQAHPEKDQQLVIAKFRKNILFKSTPKPKRKKQKMGKLVPNPAQNEAQDVLNTLHNKVVEICSKNVKFVSSLEIDGIICLDPESDDRDYTLKLHETIKYVNPCKVREDDEYGSDGSDTSSPVKAQKDTSSQFAVFPDCEDNTAADMSYDDGCLTLTNKVPLSLNEEENNQQQIKQEMQESLESAKSAQSTLTSTASSNESTPTLSGGIITSQGVLPAQQQFVFARKPLPGEVLSKTVQGPVTITKVQGPITLKTVAVTPTKPGQPILAPKPSLPGPQMAPLTVPFTPAFPGQRFLAPKPAPVATTQAPPVILLQKSVPIPAVQTSSTVTSTSAPVITTAGQANSNSQPAQANVIKIKPVVLVQQPINSSPVSSNAMIASKSVHGTPAKAQTSSAVVPGSVATTHSNQPIIIKAPLIRPTAQQNPKVAPTPISRVEILKGLGSTIPKSVPMTLTSSQTAVTPTSTQVKATSVSSLIGANQASVTTGTSTGLKSVTSIGGASSISQAKVINLGNLSKTNFMKPVGGETSNQGQLTSLRLTSTGAANVKEKIAPSNAGITHRTITISQSANVPVVAKPSQAPFTLSSQQGPVIFKQGYVNVAATKSTRAPVILSSQQGPVIFPQGNVNVAPTKSTQSPVILSSQQGHVIFKQGNVNMAATKSTQAPVILSSQQGPIIFKQGNVNVTATKSTQAPVILSSQQGSVIFTQGNVNGTRTKSTQAPVILSSQQGPVIFTQGNVNVTPTKSTQAPVILSSQQGPVIFTQGNVNVTPTKSTLAPVILSSQQGPAVSKQGNVNVTPTQSTKAPVILSQQGPVISKQEIVNVTPTKSTQGPVIVRQGPVNIITNQPMNKMTPLAKKSLGAPGPSSDEPKAKRFKMYRTKIDPKSILPAESYMIRNCAECKMDFTEYNEFGKHMEEVHKIEKPHKCIFCNKAWKMAFDLRVHIMEHSEDISRTTKQLQQQGEVKIGPGGKENSKDIEDNDEVNTQKDVDKTPEEEPEGDYEVYTPGGPIKKRTRVETFMVRTCTICNLTFDHNLNYAHHMRTEHNVTKPQKCTLCGKAFREPALLKRHIRTHLGLIKFRCPTCPAKFNQKLELKHHINQHLVKANPKEGINSTKAIILKSKLIKLKCEECKLVFIREKQYVAHMNQVHTEYKPFKCSSCGQGCGSRISLVKHEVIHTGEYPFKCEHCPKKYINRSDLLCHLRKTHNVNTSFDESTITKKKVKPKVCDICGALCVRGLKRHKKSAHTALTVGGIYPCDVCKMEFKTADLYTSHMAVDHNIFEEGTNNLGVLPTCYLCQTLFSDRKSLKNHWNLKHKTKTCERCNVILPNKRAYRTHLQNEHGEKIMCDICGKQSTSFNDLREHKKIHFEIVPDVQCEICHKWFHRKSNLNRHIRLTHSTSNIIVPRSAVALRNILATVNFVTLPDKTVQCPECLTICSNKMAAKSHYISFHTRRGPPQRARCPICDKEFHSKPALNRHLKNLHSWDKTFDKTNWNEITILTNNEEMDVGIVEEVVEALELE